MTTHRRHYQGGLIAGLLLIGLGVLFLVDQFASFDLGGYLWPFVLICIGLVFFAAMLNRGKEAGALAIPGSMFIMMGLIGFAQTILNYGASSAYAWTLVAPTSVGIGLILFGWWSEKPPLRRAGLIVTLVGVFLFLAFGALFELVFSLGGQTTPARFILPVVLVGVGLLLLFGQNLIKRFVTAVTGIAETDSESKNLDIVEPRAKNL